MSRLVPSGSSSVLCEARRDNRVCAEPDVMVQLVRLIVLYEDLKLEVAGLRVPPDKEAGVQDMGALFLAQSREYLMTEYRTKLRCAVEALPPDALWWRPNESSNSVANVVLHLTGNVRQWIVSGLGRCARRSSSLRGACRENWRDRWRTAR